MPCPDLASWFFVSCFMGSSGCAWKSSIFRLGSRMYNRRTAGKPADRSRVSAGKLESSGEGRRVSGADQARVWHAVAMC